MVERTENFGVKTATAAIEVEAAATAAAIWLPREAKEKWKEAFQNQRRNVVDWLALLSLSLYQLISGD